MPEMDYMDSIVQADSIINIYDHLRQWSGFYQKSVSESGAKMWLLSEENRRYYPIDKTDLLLGFGPIELETFRGGLERLAFERGEELIREGEESRDLYVLTRGAVSIKIHLP
jgi:hypothetical protein